MVLGNSDHCVLKFNSMLRYKTFLWRRA